MAGVSSIEVKESLADLAERVRQAKTPTAKERLQVLYWLQQENAPSISAISFIEREISKHAANLVNDLPGRGSGSDVVTPEIVWGSARDS